jgi:SAM-dependent methyltransferase
MKETTRREEPGRPAAGEQVVDKVRERYGMIAEGKISGCCGVAGPADRAAAEASVSMEVGYSDADLAAVPAGANLGLGCGAPLTFLGLAAGETVVDLGSGPGLDAFLAARQVGPGGRVIGIDMTPSMVERARRGAREAGLRQVEFREGRLERLPVEDASADAVTSNCVINLVPDKAAVFREIARVLRPGGRLVISDVVLDGVLPEVVARDLLAYVGCIAGALPRARYFAMIADAGLAGLTILKDIDYLASGGYVMPEELLARMKEEGLSPDDLEGKVRSITYRAIRPAARTRA